MKCSKTVKERFGAFCGFRLCCNPDDKKDLRIAGIDFAVPTLLFTSLFTIVLSINETNQNYQFRSVGTYAHGSFKDVDEVQITL